MEPCANRPPLPARWSRREPKSWCAAGGRAVRFLRKSNLALLRAKRPRTPPSGDKACPFIRSSIADAAVHPIVRLGANDILTVAPVAQFTQRNHRVRFGI